MFQPLLLMKNNFHLILKCIIFIMLFGCSENEVISEAETPSYNLNVIIEPISSGSVSPSMVFLKKTKEYHY